MLMILLKPFSKIRLTLYFPVFLLLFMVLLQQSNLALDNYVTVPVLLISGIAFFLFTINSMTASKHRIEQLTFLFRKEASVLHRVIVEAQNLSQDLRDELTANTIDYLRKKNHSLSASKGGDEYQALINLSQRHGKDTESIALTLIENEITRAEIAMQLRSRTYSHEWIIILSLYFTMVITTLQIPYPNEYSVIIPVSLLLSASSIFIISLWKLSNLTHKKAWQIWSPFVKLMATKFEKLD